MNAGSSVFSQLMAHASRFALDRCIRRYRGNHRVRRFTCREQFLVMAFPQLTFRESLRDIEVSLGAVPERLYHLGLRHPVSRSTLTVVAITPGNVNEVNILDHLLPEPGGST